MVNVTLRIEDDKISLATDCREQSFRLPPKPKIALDYLTKLHERCLFQSILSQCLSMLHEHTRLFIVYNSDYRDELLLLVNYLQCDYSIILEQVPSKIFPLDYCLFTQAKNILFADDAIETKFKEIYVCFYHCGDTLQNPQTATQPKSHQSTNNKRKCLIVSYFSGPCRTVGVLRPNYWLNNIPELSDHQWGIEMATATPWEYADDNVHFIPDNHYCQFMRADTYQLQPWQLAFTEIEQEQAKHINTMGYYWRIALEEYFSDSSYQYDAVIITGNPFSYFDFASFAKRQWRAKIILDYRDPFANNPRYRYSEESRQFARHIERGFNHQADLLCTVNEDCIPYTEGLLDTSITVIANGFDESHIENIPIEPLSKNHINFVHAGAIYYDRSPTALINCLDARQHKFHHIGRSTGIEPEILAHPSMQLYGQKTYQETLSIIGGADCGVVFVSETGFETPTKVYDYIAMGIDVLICTHGPLQNTALYTALQDYPGVYWCKNTPEGIAAFLENYQKGQHNNADSKMLYSRKESTLRLLAELNTLTSQVARTEQSTLA